MAITRCIGLVLISQASALRSGAFDVDYLQSAIGAVGDPSALGDDLACFCKNIKLDSECVDKTSTGPDALHFFHPATDSAPARCCKPDYLDYFGNRNVLHTFSSYKKQEQMDLCVSESRPLQSCCVLTDSLGSVGVMIKSAMAVAKRGHKASSPDETFWKSPARISTDDITGSVDYDGSPVDPEEARTYVMALLAKGRFKSQQIDGRLECQGTVQQLRSQQQECRLRTQPEKECCCPAADVEDVFRCFTMPGAFAGEPVQVLEATVSSEQRDGGTHTQVTQRPWMPAETETAARITSQDPEAEGRVWDWLRVAEQWEVACSEERELPVVVETDRTCPAGYGSHPPCEKAWRTYHTHVDNVHSADRIATPDTSYTTKILKTDPIIHYGQSSAKLCVSQAWTRKCPAGTAQYQRIAPAGTCMSETSGLVTSGSRVFTCPPDHVSASLKKIYRSYTPVCKCTECGA